MSEAMRAPSAEQAPRNRSSRRQIPELKIAPPPVPDYFESDEFSAGVDEALESAKKTEVARKERQAAEAEELAAEQARFKTHMEEAKQLREAEAAERESVKTRLRGSMDKMRAKERAKMDRHRDDRDESVGTIDIPKQTNPEFAHEEKVVFNFYPEKPAATVEEEVANLQKKLREANNDEGDVQAQINALKKDEGVLKRFGRWLSKVTNGVAETDHAQKLRILQNQLDVIHAEQRGFIDEIQLLTYKQGLGKSDRLRKAPITPESALQLETKRDEQRKEARESFGDARKKSPAALEREYGIAMENETEEEDPTIEVKEEEVDLSELMPKEEEPPKPKKSYRKIKPEGATATELKAPAGTETFVKANKEKENKTWNVEKTAYVLGKERARDIWDQVNERMLANVSVGLEINRGKGEHPATLYAFELAKAVKAQQDGDMKAFEEATNNLADWNEKLGYNNAYVNSVLARRENMDTRGIKSVTTRRTRSKNRERSFLKP